jgi:hypothetical protein
MIASSGAAPESPVSWMLRLCNTSAATFQNVSGQNTPLLPLGWGATAINRRLVCIRGRRVFRSYEGSDGDALAMWSLKRQQVPLFNLSDLNIAFPSLASRKVQVQGDAPPFSLASLPPERPDTHRDIVLHTGLIGVIAATYLHGFHVLVNTLIPLVHVLQGRYHHGVESAMVEGTVDNSSQRGARFPFFDVTLLRHPYFGAKFSGGEQLSFEFASTLATTPNASSTIEEGTETVRQGLFPSNITADSVKAASQRSAALERRRRSPRVLHRADFIEREDTTHCYCDAVLHDMIDSEFMSSVPQTQKIVLGDPLRRRSTRFVKVSLNERYGFLPYGTYPIPPHEYQNYHLWVNREGEEGHGGGDDNSTAPATVTPRLLLLLRNRTRELGDADAVVAMARAAGFHVHVMVPERESIAQQARAARYADLMMGVHGQALTWSMMMDGTAATHCREVLELTGFGRPLRGMQNVFEVLAADSYLKYSRTQPADVDFVGSTCGQCPALRKILLTAKFPQTRRAFNWQRVWFGASRELPLLLQKSFDSLQKCLLPNKPVPLPASALEQSDRAVPNYPGGKL